AACQERTIDGQSSCLGLMPLIRSYITIRGAGRGVTWIRGKTTVWDDSHPYRNSLVHVNGAYPTSTCNDECLIHDIEIRDISFEDLNDLQTVGYFGFFGASMAQIGPGYGYTIDNTE